jgi:hypothetical protein
MVLNFVKNKIFWTRHSKEKMRQYQLSERRILKVLRKPERKEKGIVPGTICAMITVGTRKHPKEIWVMYQIKNSKKITIISAWRYPGKSQRGEFPPIPEDVLFEIKN